MKKVRVLFTGGSFNQTTQLAQIADALPGEQFDVWFTPAYADGLLVVTMRWEIVGPAIAIVRSVLIVAAVPYTRAHQGDLHQHLYAFRRWDRPNDVCA
jgi:hypothetical protein